MGQPRLTDAHDGDIKTADCVMKSSLNKHSTVGFYNLSVQHLKAVFFGTFVEYNW